MIIAEIIPGSKAYIKIIKKTENLNNFISKIFTNCEKLNQ